MNREVVLYRLILQEGHKLEIFQFYSIKLERQYSNLDKV